MEGTLQDIKNCTSLNNLKKAKPKGQIATLLILVITAILIFTLVVMNIGQVSNYATNLSNAADSASLYLASQLGTKAYQLSESLMNSCGRPHRCCTKTGLLSIILAIIVAIIAIVVTWLTWGGTSPFLSWAWVNLWTVVAAGAVGGAIGGGIGGAIAGTGALQGAIQGAMIGAAIGGGLSYGAGWGFKAGMYGILGILGSSLPSVPTCMIIGASLGATLAVASSIYSAYAKDAMLGDAMAAAAKALSGLPETQRIRESIFLQALSETIDDPNKVVDDVDSDGDGNTTELVPNFQVCWDQRITELKEGNIVTISEAQNLVDQFLKSSSGAVQRFKAQADIFKSNLSRQEVEGNDGTVTLLLRALEEDFGYTVSFWDKGPSGADLEAWKNSWKPEDCPTCETYDDPLKCPECEIPDPPAGYDELDYAIDELSDFNEEMQEFSEQESYMLVYNWEQWVGWFYDPESTGGEGTPDDYYSSLERMINGDDSSEPVRIGLNGWINEIERIRQQLPECIYGGNYYDGEGNWVGCAESQTGCDCILNTPCRDGRCMSTGFGTIDTDFDDEFQEAKNIISEFINAAEEFQREIIDFHDEMARLMESLDLTEASTTCGLSGTNPITYSWRDSRCPETNPEAENYRCHSITVSLDSYNMPYIRRKKSGNWLKGKKCFVLMWADQNVGVEITRQDPANVNVGISGLLGQWNPSGGTIHRRSTAHYRGYVGSDSVSLVGR